MFEKNVSDTKKIPLSAVTLSAMESDTESKALVAAESGPLKTAASRAGMLVPRVIAAALVVVTVIFLRLGS
jgi:hypothetical protein